jgi:hypothetical protein
MSKEIYPVVGRWYKESDGQTFEVVAVDDDDETVEVQYADGAVEEFDMESWNSMELTALNAPEHLGGMFDELEYEEDGGRGVFDSQERWSDYLDDFD